jgi:hypothetical protein
MRKYSGNEPVVEVRESEVKDTGIDIVRRRRYPNKEEFPAQIPDNRKDEMLKQFAEYVDGYEVVSTEEAELIESAKETLCD